MTLTPQSIRKGIQIKFNGNIVDKDVILETSKNWTEKQISIFKKFLKQGGKFKIQNIRIEITPPDQILTSKGEKPSGKMIAPGADQRF